MKSMLLATEAQQQQVAQRITAIETKTDAELVCVLATRSFPLPAFLIRCLPKKLRYRFAKISARKQFIVQNLHQTQNQTGLLIFISEAERYVEIMADSGIHKHVPNDVWQNIVNQLIAQIKQHNTLPGLLTCLDQCGELLAQHVPATNQKNELPNRLILL